MASHLVGSASVEVGPTDKLFLVTRDDLEAGQQGVQAAHALREFVDRHPEVDQTWYRSSNHLAFLAVPDERALKRLEHEAMKRGVRYASFREPDRADELTAVALEPSPAARRLCRRLPLALKGR